MCFKAPFKRITIKKTRSQVTQDLNAICKGQNKTCWISTKYRLGLFCRLTFHAYKKTSKQKLYQTRTF